MNRDIKFRVWDKAHKDMNCWNSLLGFDFHEYLEMTHQFAFMQYTGLKDKNGVEIYEGDIIHIVKNRFGVGKHEVWTVEFEEGSFQAYNQLNSFRVLTNGMNFYRHDKESLCTPIAEFNTYGENDYLCEVKGNIYENPELLK